MELSATIMNELWWLIIVEDSSVMDPDPLIKETYICLWIDLRTTSILYLPLNRSNAIVKSFYRFKFGLLLLSKCFRNECHDIWKLVYFFQKFIEIPCDTSKVFLKNFVKFFEAPYRGVRSIFFSYFHVF